jgi:hypothetical protein
MPSISAAKTVVSARPVSGACVSVEALVSGIARL